MGQRPAGTREVRGWAWLINYCSPWTPKDAGGWLTIATSGSYNAGRGRLALPARPASPTPVGVGFPFVGSKKTTLDRLFREMGISLTPDAQARLDALPEQFLDFVAAPARFAAQTEAKAA